jgi:hypothetical protein
MVRYSVIDLLLASSGVSILQLFVCGGSRVIRGWPGSPGSDGASGSKAPILGTPSSY